MDKCDLAEAFATLWHDAKAPITAAVGYVELLLYGKLGDLTEKQRQALEMVRKSCRCTKEFWDHAEDYIRLQHWPEQIAWNWEPLSLAEVIDESLQELNTYSYWQMTAAEIRLPSDLPPVRGDRRWLRRAFAYALDPLSSAVGSGQLIEADQPQSGLVAIRVHNTVNTVQRSVPDTDLEQVLLRPGSRLHVASCIAREHGGRLILHLTGHERIEFRFDLPVWTGDTG